MFALTKMNVNVREQAVCTPGIDGQHVDEQAKAEKNWVKIITRGSIFFVAPNGIMFNSLSEIRIFFIVMNGIENDLDDFLERTK